MRPFASTIPLTEALATLRAAATPIDRIEPCPLHAAAGRVLASDLRASRDVPPFDRAAMDGVAVRARDTAQATPERPVVLRVVGTVFTGEAPDRVVADGECLVIATGAPLPPGADAVVMVEQTRSPDRDHVEIADARDLRRERRVTRLRHPRRRPDPRGGLGDHPGARGRAGRARSRADRCLRAPRVFLASTGNEVIAPGAPLGAGQIYDVNRYTLAPVVTTHGGDPLVGGTAVDSVEALRRTLDAARAARADLVVLSGGSSVGDRDLLVDAVAGRGELLFHGIAVKPGKPTLFARLGPQLLLGMPGNPTSCLSNAYILLIPLLRRMARLPEWHPNTRVAPLAHPVANTSGRHTFYTVRLENGLAVPAFKGSATSRASPMPTATSRSRPTSPAWRQEPRSRSRCSSASRWKWLRNTRRPPGRTTRTISRATRSGSGTTLITYGA